MALFQEAAAEVSPATPCHASGFMQIWRRLLGVWSLCNTSRLAVEYMGVSRNWGALFWDPCQLRGIPLVCVHIRCPRFWETPIVLLLSSWASLSTVLGPGFAFRFCHGRRSSGRLRLGPGNVLSHVPHAQLCQSSHKGIFQKSGALAYSIGYGRTEAVCLAINYQDEDVTEPWYSPEQCCIASPNFIHV